MGHGWVGNSAGVLVWAVLSRRRCVLADSCLQHRLNNILRIGGGRFPHHFSVFDRSYNGARGSGPRTSPPTSSKPAKGGGWRIGVTTSLSNPEVGRFSLSHCFPQFLTPNSAVLPARRSSWPAVIVTIDPRLVRLDHLSRQPGAARPCCGPQVQRVMERITGGVLVGVGVLLLAGT